MNNARRSIGFDWKRHLQETLDYFGFIVVENEEEQRERWGAGSSNPCEVETSRTANNKLDSVSKSHERA